MKNDGERGSGERGRVVGLGKRQVGDRWKQIKGKRRWRSLVRREAGEGADRSWEVINEIQNYR